MCFAFCLLSEYNKKKKFKLYHIELCNNRRFLKITANVVLDLLDGHLIALCGIKHKIRDDQSRSSYDPGFVKLWECNLEQDQEERLTQ